jgi:Zn-dependent alcohol dehydrogenase
VVASLTEVGVDVAFDAVGSSALLRTGLAVTRAGGTTVMVGAAPLDDQLVIDSPTVMGATGRKLVGCLLGSVNSLRDIPRLIALYQAGQLDLEGLITQRRPLDDINLAFDDMRAGRGIRTVIAL